MLLHPAVLFRFSLLLLISWSVFAQQPTFSNLRVEKKPGKESGPVMVTSLGKNRRVLPEATQVWAGMGGTHALALVPPSKKNPHYHLRFLDMVEVKGRDLGDVPFTQAEFSEQNHGKEDWVFVLRGTDAQSKQPITILADTYAVRARLTGEPKIDAENLPRLLGSDMENIFQTPNEPKYVQFLPDGSAVVQATGKEPETGRWWTDGQSMNVQLANDSVLNWPRESLTKTQGVPAGLHLNVRLSHVLSSYTSKEGSPVEGVLISPAIIDEKTLIPAGSKVTGTVTKAHGVGLAMVHETAAMTVEFSKVELPDGTSMAIHSRLFQVENSREKVNTEGSIRGLRSTGTLGYSARGQLVSLSAFDPVAYLFTSVTSTAVLGFTEPEILYPAGTEFLITLTAPVITSTAFPAKIPPLSTTDTERRKMLEFVRALPFRTTTQAGNKPSDITNLLFLGSEEGLRRAFKAAGWVNVHQLTAASTFQTLKSIAGDEGYNEAPMSTLVLDERPPIFTLSKTTNTFSSRHHLRVFDPAMKLEGLMALTSSSTQDIGIAFSRKKKTFIHVIDEYIDNERSKVVNDLTFTGCVDAIELVPRSWIPQDAYNSTGDRLRTDGAIAVLKINDCMNPNAIPAGEPERPGLWKRSIRNTMLTLRNDVMRGNLAYQGFTGVRKLHGFMAKNGDLKADPGAWRKADVSGADYQGYGTLPMEKNSSREFNTDTQPLTAATADHRWDPPRYEIALQGGLLKYPTKELEAAGISLISPNPALPSFAVVLFDEIDDGWAAALSVTINTWRWVSNEFTYSLQRGKYGMGALAFANGELPGDVNIDFEPYIVGLETRQFEYNLLLHARPRESRWRPYIAAGPVLQLIRLSDAPIKRASPGFRLGMQNIGLLKAAFDFGRTPPLEGGGIFQVGLQYGGGIKFRVHPRITLRADFRETWSKNPEFIKDSYIEADPTDLDPSYDYQYIRERSAAKFRQQRYTIGIAFTF